VPINDQMTLTQIATAITTAIATEGGVGSATIANGNQIRLPAGASVVDASGTNTFTSAAPFTLAQLN
jgi:hypothetical protein